jgi:hypothetical protein
MIIKKCIFISTLMVLLFMSVSTQCGTTVKPPKCFTKQKIKAANNFFYEKYNPVFIKYFF